MYKKMSFVCEKCNKSFKSEKSLDRHKENVLNPCDFICRGCGYEAGSKGGFYRHKKECQKHQDLQQVVNNVSTNNIDASNHNTQNINNNLNNNLNQNIVLLQPFEVERQYMSKKAYISPVRGTLLDLVKQGKMDEAYELLFNHIHGNELHPEYHNIYLPDINRNEVAVFRGKNFKLEDWDKRIPGLFEFLRHEMKRLVWSYDDVNTFTHDEKDELHWQIDKHWREVNEKDDPYMKRTLYNNRNVVFETFEKYIVKPHSDMIRTEFLYAGQYPPKLNKNHLVRLA
jgi:hypothetical protein